MGYAPAPTKGVSLLMQWVWLSKGETRGERRAMVGSLPRIETLRDGHLFCASFSLAAWLPETEKARRQYLFLSPTHSVHSGQSDPSRRQIMSWSSTPRPSMASCVLRIKSCFLSVACKALPGLAPSPAHAGLWPSHIAQLTCLCPAS